MSREELWRRMQLVAVFALLLGCLAAPVIAQAESTDSQPEDDPALVAEREESEYAYADLTTAQQVELLKEVFEPQLQAIDADPARALSDVILTRVDSPTEALALVDGDQVLLESEIPLRAPEEDGDLHKVDLGLEQTENGYEPANPLVDLSLPDSAAEPIQVGDEGIAITALDASATQPQQFGEEDLFLPEAQEDTSLLLSPISGGLEISAMLLSRNSPERLAFQVTLPQGARLAATGTGGAEVVSEADEVLATVTAPLAFDAQESDLPVTLTVDGNTLIVELAHRELDVAYPLFVDPEVIEENWSGFSDTSKLAYWHWAWSGVGPEDFIGRTSCIATCWGNGLYVRSRANFAYPAGSWGRWWFTPQGSTTFIRRIILGPINYDAHGCIANEPHPYVGVWNDYTGWKVHNSAYPFGWSSWIDTGETQNLGVGTRTAFVGIEAAGATNIKCGHDYRLGGATLFLDDPEKPTLGTPTGYFASWVKDGAPFAVNVPVSDPGLGVYSATISPDEAPPIGSKQLSCDGHYSNPCPANHTFQFNVSADSFDEGEKGVRLSAKDAVEKTSETFAWTMKVDRKPPEIDLAGQLAQATDETEGDGEDGELFEALGLPVYNLAIAATDGSTASEATKRSGVKSIEVILDDKVTPEKVWNASSCPASSCPMSQVFTLKLNELSAGTHHTLRVLARDFAGNMPRERKIEFEYIPATGMKDEYVMQYFPLPDGSGNEGEEENPRRPELAVNLVSGNLVYRQKDIEVEGAAADLEVERYYNSLLPESQNTEWGDGWTLAQTPTIEPEEPGSPNEATMVEESGSVESSIDLPATTGEEVFDENLQAVITKEPGGGYEIADETGETGTAIALEPSGEVDELRTGSAATVDYSYEGEELSEIAVEDPGTVNVDPGTLNEGKQLPTPALSHSAALGSTGTGQGQLESPSDLATDAQGNLWVLDRGNNRVQKFGPDGQFVSQFGAAGSGDGQLNAPSAIAIDSAGDLWIADKGNNRVQKFSPGGQFLAKFGAYGTNPGQLWSPNGIAVGADGSIWVSDFIGVQRFTAGGQFIERVGAPGTAPGQTSQPQSLDADSSGNVFVAEVGSDRVSVFDEDGDYLRLFGSSGTGAGQFSNPTEVDVDADGNVWVGDSQSNRVQLFTAAGDYIAAFGAPGTGAGQLSLDQWLGIASDGKGRVWVSDPGSDRVQRWVVSRFDSFFHSAALGSTGTGQGQLESPSDLATDAQGNLWVLDRGNNRVQKFGPDGQFVSQFGAAGSGDGQLNAPSAIAIDSAGDLWIADKGNNRVQKFSPGGQFLAKFGAYGTNPGQLWSPNGIAVGADGSIWVSDFIGVQRFTAGGQFIERVGAPGTAPGQTSQPQSLDADSSGNVFVAEVGSDRVSVFDEDGDYLRLFGSSGTGAGQFSNPTEVDVDADGNVWVGDSQSNRVQLFTAAGDYIAAFGAPGTGAGQLSLDQWLGIASDGKGRVWVSDPGSDRVQEWIAGHQEPGSSSEGGPTDDDPQVEINVSEDLVESVEGAEAGTVSYEHSNDLLTTVTTSEGEYDYAYDSAGRMTKVTLPNGTYAEVAYEPTYGRVKSVTVALDGTYAKTTYFEYSDEPRRTTVTPPDAPVATYDIAADGSILRWSDAKEPPTFDDIAGNLYDNRETAEPIVPGIYNLVVQPHSEHGIDLIQVVANGNQLVSEKACPQDPEMPGTECKSPVDEWVLETGNWPPGVLYLEVIATDRLSQSASERLWVNIPYTPPPDPEGEEPPKFSEVQQFREEMGLDVDLKGNELIVNDRIFDTINDWHNPQTPAGEVARAAMERWGVPLRPADMAELDYRDFYVPRDTSSIRKWGISQGSAAYAGYSVDHRAGGIIYVSLIGGKAEQEDLLASVQSNLLAPSRVKVAPGTAVRTETQLRAIRADIGDEVITNMQLAGKIGGIWIDVATNQIVVASSHPIETKELLSSQYGSALAVVQGAGPLPQPAKYSRYNAEGPVQAGDEIYTSGPACTAGFGAWDQADGKRKSNGEQIFVPLQLTAGHCFPLGANVRRGRSKETNIGKVSRNNYVEDPAQYPLDAATIRTNWPNVGRSIYISQNKEKGVTGYETPVPGQLVCVSGVKTDRRVCGPVLDEPKESFSRGKDGQRLRSLDIPVGANVSRGDSGGPAWVMGSGQAAGLITGAENGTYGYPKCTDLGGGPYDPAVDENYICPVVRITTVQQIVSGAATLYNAGKLAEEGVGLAEPLHISGVTTTK